MFKKSHLAAFVLVAAGCLYSTGAFAQAQATGTTTAGVNITLQGNIQSSIVLAVSGVAGNTDLTGTTQTGMPTRATGTVDFGSFSTQSAAPTGGTGSLVRAGSGAYAIARLAFTPTFSGNASGPDACNVNLTLGTTGGSSPIDANNTRLNNTYSGTNAVGGWTAVGANQPLTSTPVSACPNQNTTTGNCSSGSTYTHELAVYVPDTQAAGTFSQVVLYDATTY